MIVAVDGDHHIISIENTPTTIQFLINEAAPDVIANDIHWIYSEAFTISPYEEGNIDITDSDTIYSYSADNRQLHISAINESNEGRYFIIASNPAGVEYSYIDIIVHGQYRECINYTLISLYIEMCVCIIYSVYLSVY